MIPFRTCVEDPADRRLNSLEWRVSAHPVNYPDAVARMERRVEHIRGGRAPELVWLLEHPSLYTAGTSARPEELLAQGDLPVFHTGRGGRYTYHGPGQRVAYLMLDLTRWKRDVRAYVSALEQWIIESLAVFGVHGERRAGRVGIWVDCGDGNEAKVAAIGVRVRRWVTYHGIAINLDPDLSLYQGIVPCGLADRRVTSLRALGIELELPQLDAALRHTFVTVFGNSAERLP